MGVLAQARRHRFSAADVMRMVEVGILGEDDHLELIDGELIEMSPQGPRHISLKDNLRILLASGWSSDSASLHGEHSNSQTVHIRDQGPLDVGQHSLPEPDLAVIRGRPRDYLDAHATGKDALLVVEIAVTSQDIDRAKAEIYARGGVPVYWLLDVPARQLEVYEHPTADGLYRTVTTVAATDDKKVSVTGADRAWLVADMLP